MKEKSHFKREHDEIMNVKASSSDKLTTGITLLHQKYVLCQLLGKGAFGEVYRAIRINSNFKQQDQYPPTVAIKVETDLTRSETSNEIQVIQAIHQQIEQKTIGFPKIFAHGVENGAAFIVMDLMGPNLQDLMTMCGGKFSEKTTLILIIQIIEKLQILHGLGYVYRDIKPQNFIMGIGKLSRLVHMVDFGLCKKYEDIETNLHLPYQESVPLAGTIRYSSISSHLGIDQTRRDDLEAVLYLMIYFLKGVLPWQGLSFEHKFEKDYVIMDKKLKFSNSQLCKDLPLEIYHITEYIRNLSFYEEPDYLYIITQIKNAYQQKYGPFRLTYDWERLPDARLQKNNVEIIISRKQSKPSAFSLPEQHAEGLKRGKSQTIY